MPHAALLRGPKSLPLRPLISTSLVTLVLTALAPSAHAAATPRVHAIVNARIVTAPGQVIPRGTVVMRDGVIVAVGANLPVPADARVWPGDSLTVYPGLIDAFVMPPETPSMPGPMGAMGGGRPGAAPSAPPRGAAHELASVTPETRAVESAPLPADQIESLRRAGFAVAQVAPRKGIVRGQSAVVGLGDDPLNAGVVRADAAQVFAFQPEPRVYPSSLMGAIAVVRQALLDAKWYRDARALYAKSPAGRERPPENVSWAALQPVTEVKQTALFVAPDMLGVLQAAAVAKEAGLAAQAVAGGDEYKRLKEVAATGLPLIVPVNFPDPPDVSDDASLPEVSTIDLREWDEAPGNPAALRRAGVTFALTANGLRDLKTFRANVAKAIQRGLPADDALAAVTTVPARLLGLSDRLGVIAAGRIADLTVTRGDLFSDKGEVRDVWVDGDRYEVAKDATSPKGTWTLDWGRGHGQLIVSVDKDTTVSVVVGADTVRATGVRLEDKRLRFTAQAGGPVEDFDLAFANDALAGTLVARGVGQHHVTGVAVRKEPPKKPAKDEPVPVPAVAGDPEAWRAPEPPQPAALLVRNATLWTSGPRGVLQNADLLVRAGKIAAVGPNLAAPAGAVVVDAAGKHVAPGIFDEHSHSAVVGEVNECTNSVTAEVRIEDVVNSESVNIYRQLAAGVTAMHLLHGSCNCIGGQCAVIKNRWGAAPRELLLAGAPPTIKFALGENPKESNDASEYGIPSRYPQSRAGVEETIRDAFTRARDYREAFAEWKAGKRALPPRRDLQLDAVAEILEGRRFIHAHAYRQDEILMLLRLTQAFGIKVDAFEHTLEGYKVADEMAKAGAGANTFSDWWAYKYEVIDAIPWGGYLMWDRGVTVTYGSDSDEQARRLNTEAAKAVKYGGVPPAEALEFVTLNAAKQTRLESRIGSLEPGKDADFAIWSGSPLSPYSVCEQTWVDGRKYFDRAADLAGRAALARERDALIAKAKAAKKEGGGGPPGMRGMPPRYLQDADLGGDADAVREMEGLR